MKYLFVVLLLVLVVLGISYTKGNLPPDEVVEMDADFIELTSPPKEVADLLKNHCYDCHSAQATYPKKAHFAPYHKKYVEPVMKGREKLNFSKWSSYTPELQKVLLLVAVEQMENKAMPMTGIFPKGNDTLTQNSKNLLIHWLAQEGEAGM